MIQLMYSFSKYLSDWYAEDTEWSWVLKGLKDKQVMYLFRSDVSNKEDNICVTGITVSGRKYYWKYRI